MTPTESRSGLAVLGGEKAVKTDPGDIFAWPIVTKEDEEAVLDVLRRGAMSEGDVTSLFEEELAEYFGPEHAIGYCNGTAALRGGMFGCGVGVGDEIIAPSLTYWASVMPVFSLGATVVFADVLPDTICIDPGDIEHRITKRTKAIVCVHYCGYPCDMDPIMEIAGRHGIKVIEDVSHAHGGLYRGRMLGSIGDVGCFSMMSGKGLACGEAGALVTDDRTIFERATAFGFYGRTGAGASRYANGKLDVTMPELAAFGGVPLGGCKDRMNQTCSAMGRVQLRRYPERVAEIQKAMNHFWDGLEGVPGIRPHRPPADSGSTMGGWYCPIGLYRPEELDDLPAFRFCEAVRAEGVTTWPGVNSPLHLHPFFHDADVYGHGKPTMIANASRDVRQGAGSLPVTEEVPTHVYTIPWFKHLRPDIIDEHVAAFRKVAENHKDLPRE